MYAVAYRPSMHCGSMESTQPSFTAAGIEEEEELFDDLIQTHNF